MAETHPVGSNDKDIGSYMDMKHIKMADVPEDSANLHGEVNESTPEARSNSAAPEKKDESPLSDLLRETKIAVRQKLGRDFEKEDIANTEDRDGANIGDKNECCGDSNSESLEKKMKELDYETLLAIAISGDRDPNKRRSEGEGDGNDAEETKGDIEEVAASCEDDASPTAVEDHDTEVTEVKKKDENERIEDVFQKEIIPRFAGTTEFKKYARASNGLNIDDIDLSDLFENNPKDIKEFKFSVLLFWKQKNKDRATCERIRNITDAYLSSYTCTENPQVSNKSGVDRSHPTPGGAEDPQAPNNSGANPSLPIPGGAEGTSKTGFNDVFQNEIIPAFASIGEFKQFARDSNGLRLDSAVVIGVVADHPTSTHDQMMKMLLIWKQNNKGATPDDIIKIKNKY
ncbi:uncharacterized protein LOC120339951 isoform X1 [Styela clava]